MNKNYIDIDTASKYFKKAYSSNNEISSINFKKDEIISIGATINYIAFTQNDKTPVMLLPLKDDTSHYLEIDNASKRNLEITKTLNGERDGSLFNSLNFTLTATGSRKLLSDLSYPLSDLNTIKKRLDLVSFFYDNFEYFNIEIKKQISNFPDISRALNRLSLGRGGPKDLYSICKGLKNSINLFDVIDKKLNSAKRHSFFSNLFSLTKDNVNTKDLISTLDRALSENPPLFARDGNFIKIGFNEELDKVRKFSDEAKTLIIKEEINERKLSGINNLKIKYNNFLGYFIEITNANNSKLDNFNGYYIHRQTLKNSFRYTTKNLIAISEKILNANYKTHEIEIEIYENLLCLTLKSSVNILKVANLIARIDVSFSWAIYAKKYGAIRPLVNEKNNFEIKNGRHPSVEKTHADSFIANSCILNNKKNNILD